MMKSIHFSVINGEIKAPPSKSYMIRALAAGLLYPGTSEIYNPCSSDDSLSAIEVIMSLGAQIKYRNNILFISGDLKPVSKIIDCGESGLCARMFSAIAPLSGKKLTITGRGSLIERDLSDVTESLNNLGVKCKDSNNKLPFEIEGIYSEDEYTIDCSKSSQFLTGLLISYPNLVKGTIINVHNLKSKPYIDMTIKILKKFGIHIRHTEYNRFFLYDLKFNHKTMIKVEGDWSNAAFMLVAGAIAGQVTISGLNLNSTQGDKNILEILSHSGANISINESKITIRNSGLSSFIYDASETPDLFPPLVALAVNCLGTSRIKGIDRLINKESNRADALIQEFTKIGCIIQQSNNEIVIEGKKPYGGETESYNDHRIAMALAIAGLTSEKPVIINNSECVSKSYKRFFDDLKIIGGIINE